MTRREMMALLGAATAQQAMAQSALKFRGLDHIEFTVADVEKSIDFYAELFGGADVMKNRTTTRRYIKLGTSYMAIDRTDAPRIDHACIGVENFDINAIHAFLTAQGLIYRDYPSGRDTGVNDPDGTRLQLSSVDGWTSLAAQTASPEPRRVAGIVQALELSEVQIYVADLAAGRAHYGKLLGAAPGRTYSVGEGSVELLTSSPGFNTFPGFNRFTVFVRSLDPDNVGQRLKGLGAKIESTAPNGVQFLDPDGFRVELALPNSRPVA